MKNKKLLMSGLGTVLAISSVAPVSMLSASCSAETRFGAIGGEYDKEFGVSQATYKALKTSFWSQYKTKLLKNPETASAANIAREKTRLFNTFNTFDKRLKRDKTMSYTLATEGLIDYASRTYGIKLKRDNTAQKSDIQKMFDGALNSVKAYMESNPQAYSEELRELIVNNANNEFNNNLLPNLENKYDDPLSILIQLRSQMALCFADLNSTVSLISSTLRLKQFISDYKFEYAPKEGSYLDNFDASLVEGVNISKILLKAYNITDPKGNPVKSFDGLLPGYKIKPILNKVVRDPYANEYYLDVDWQCARENLTSNIDPDKVTAHLYKINIDTLKDKDNIKDISDIVDKSTVQSVKYPISYSLKAERDILRQVYLGQNTTEYTQSLDFSWDEPSKCAFDFFANAEKLDKETNGVNEIHKLDLTSLTGAGLKVGVKDVTSSNEIVASKRLDEIIGKTLVPSEEDKRQPNVETADLINKMLQYCKLTSFASLDPDSKTNDVRADLRLSYANSYHNEDDRMVAALNDKDMSNLTISDTIYDMLNIQYNKMMSVFDIYTNNKFEDDLDKAENALILSSIGFSLNTILMGVCTGLMFINPVKAPWMAAIIITAAASVGLQAWSLEIMVDHKWNPTREYARQTCHLQQMPEVRHLQDTFLEMAKDMGFILRNENKEILLSDYKTAKSNFTNLAWSDVKKVVDWFNGAMKPDGDFGKFITITERLSISPEEYQHLMKEWGENGKYTNQTGYINGASIILDAINIILCIAAPEAKTLTQAIAENGATARAVEKSSIEEGTKILKDTQGLNKYSSAKEFGMPVPASEIEDAGKLSLADGSQYRAIKNTNVTEEEFDIASDYIKDENAIVTYFKPEGEAREVLNSADLTEAPDRLTQHMYDLVDTSYETRVIHQRYGTIEGAPNGGTYENFMKDLTAINPDGTAKLPCGPEIYKDLRTYERSAGDFEGSVRDFLNDAALGREGSLAEDFSEEAVEQISQLAKTARDAANPEEYGNALDELLSFIQKDQEIGALKPWTEDTRILDDLLLTPGQRRFYQFAERVIVQIGNALNRASRSAEEAYRLVKILSPI